MYGMSVSNTYNQLAYQPIIMGEEAFQPQIGYSLQGAQSLQIEEYQPFIPSMMGAYQSGQEQGQTLRKSLTGGSGKGGRQRLHSNNPQSQTSSCLLDSSLKMKRKIVDDNINFKAQAENSFDGMSDAATSASDETQSTHQSGKKQCCKPQKIDLQYQEATVKRPKKKFQNKRDRENFVEQYKMKFKTEMCRNWELFGRCKFENNCSFAHGDHELHKKAHVPNNFKTRSCTQFQATGFCPYGSRCQFMHSQFSVSNKKLNFMNVLTENVRLSMERSKLVQDVEENQVYMNVFSKPRLQVFKSLAQTS